MIQDFEEFVNEANIQRNKVIASDGTVCRGILKYCNKNGELSGKMDELLKAHHFVEEVETTSQKLAAFKFQSAVREADLANCKVLLYETEKGAKLDMERFFEEEAHKLEYNVYRDAIQKKENPKQCDFILAGPVDGKALSL